MLGDKIKKLRKLAGYSQEQIARKLNISQGAISQWERNATVPASEQLIALADVLRVSVDDLLERKPEAERVEEDVYEIREWLRRSPSNRMLFSLARNASPEHVKAAAAMLKALEPDDNGGYYPDD